MCEFTANDVQTVAVGSPVIFTDTVVCCRTGDVKHRKNTGTFLLSGKGCPCTNTRYIVNFSSNIAISNGGTVGPISLAIQIDGTTIPESTMIVTPAAVGEFFNVNKTISIDIWRNCCETISIVNTSTTPIQVENATLIINK